MKQKHIELIADALREIGTQREVMNLFDEQPNFGWERWLQVELAVKLKDLGKPVLEVVHSYDRRKKVPLKKSGYSNLFVDLEFVKKNNLKNKKVAIEIKLNDSLKGLGALLTDFLRLGAIPKTKWEWRSVIGILCYLPSKKDTKFSQLHAQLLEHFGAKEVDLGKHKAIVFGWERNLTANMTLANYQEWLQSVKDAFAHHGVKRETARPAR